MGHVFQTETWQRKRERQQQEDLSDTVKINIGIMVPDSGQLRRVRGKSLTVNVPKNATASMLLEAGAAKHKAHSNDIIKQEYNYVLLYEDCTEVKTLKESSEAFVLHKYKNECGKPYHRLNFFLCEALEFTQRTYERFIESNPESTLSSEENNEEDIVPFLYALHAPVVTTGACKAYKKSKVVKCFRGRFRGRSAIHAVLCRYINQHTEL